MHVGSPNTAPATPTGHARGVASSAPVLVGHANPKPSLFDITPQFDWTNDGSNDLLVHFTQQSTAPRTGPLTYLWNFGDGTTSTSSSPSHTYARPGIYDVILTATAGDGSWGIAVDYVQVRALPNAMFLHVNVARTTSFQDVSSSPNSAILSRSWDFGDGGTSTAQNPTHTYAADHVGGINVTLTVTDEDGWIGTKTTSCIVHDLAPVAGFTFAATGKFVAFTDTSTDDAYVASWAWDFGDSSGTSTAQNPTYTYDSDGTYTAQLTATDGAGNTNAVSHSVTVAAGVVSVSSLSSGTNSDDGVLFVTPIVAPTAGAFEFAFISTARGGTIKHATATGCGLAWAEIGSIDFFDVATGNYRRGTLLTATATAPLPGAVTFDFAGQLQTSFCYSVVEVRNGVAVPQVVANSPGVSATSLATTLAALAASNSVHLNFSITDAHAAMTKDSNFTSLFSGIINAGNQGFLASYSTNRVTCTNTFASAYPLAISLEVSGP